MYIHVCVYTCMYVCMSVYVCVCARVVSEAYNSEEAHRCKHKATSISFIKSLTGPNITAGKGGGVGL